mgnify:CR=1 FL=1
MQEQRSNQALGWRQRLYHFFPTNIRNKIILPYLLLTMIVAMMGIFVVTRLVVSTLDERFTNQLIEAGRIVADSLVRQEREHWADARAIAFTVGLAEALRDGDWETAAEIANPAAVAREVEVCFVVDAEGREVLHQLRRADGGDDSAAGQFNVLDLDIVPSLLRANDPNAQPKRALMYHPVVLRYYYVTAIPIELNGQVVGVVAVGTSLDTLIQYFREVSLADIIIYLNGSAVATTFSLAEQPDAVDTLLESLSISPVEYDRALHTFDAIDMKEVKVRNRSYRIALGPLRIADDTLGVFAVALPLKFVIEGGLASRNTYAFIFTLGMAGVILVGYLISQHITRPLGRLVWTSQAVADGDLDQRTGIISTDEIGILAGTFDEMTERLAERTYALEETVGRMQAILSSMGDGVMMEDLEGNLITLNTAANQMLEDMAVNFMLGPLRDLSSLEYDLEAEGMADPWQLDHRRFEVGAKMISVHSATVMTDDGDRLGTVIVMRDVTAEVEAERLKDQFITHVSHELRTPLTVVKGFSDLLLSGAAGDITEAQQDFMGTIGRHIDDLIAMVNELIDFSEMEASGQLGLVTRPTDLRSVVEEVVEEWRPRMEDKDLTLHIDLAPQVPQVNADGRRMRWALLHLVRNALQYTPSGGDVSVRYYEQDGHVVIDVQDTGIGLSPQDHERLFSRFYRVTNMPEEDVRGLGVGLYLTGAIVEAHGGKIQVESKVGVGSTFSIILPAVNREQEQ